MSLSPTITPFQHRSYPSFALPLLEGLSKQESRALTSIVDEALREEEAISLIQRFCRTSQRRFKASEEQRIGSTNKDVSKRSRTTQTGKSLLTPARKRSRIDSQDSGGTQYGSGRVRTGVVRFASNHHSSLKPLPKNRVSEHWLWRSLRAYPAAERIAATRLIIGAIPKRPVESHQTDSSMDNFILRGTRQFHRRILNRVIQLLNQHVILLSQNGQQQGYHEEIVGCPPYRLAIEWVAILEHLWTSVEYRTLDAFTVENTCSYYRNAWKWLTGSIWHCACRVQKLHQSCSSSFATAATTLASLAYLALTLSIHRTCHIKPILTSTANKAGSVLNKKSTAVSLRQRSNSNSSCRSNDSNTKKSVNTTNTKVKGNIKVTSCTESCNEETRTMKELQAVNSRLLWYVPESASMDELSSLACLIEAYLVTQDFVGRTNYNEKHSSQPMESNDVGFTGASVLCIGGGSTAAIVALQQAAHTLEQLISPSKECKITTVYEQEKNKKEHLINDASSVIPQGKKEISSSTEASTLEKRREQRRRQQIKLETNYHLDDHDVEDFDYHNEIDEEDDDLFAEDEDDEIDDANAGASPKKVDTESTAETIPVAKNATNDLEDHIESFYRNDDQQDDIEDDEVEGEDDDEEGNDEVGSRILGEEDDDFESIECDDDDDDEVDVGDACAEDDENTLEQIDAANIDQAKAKKQDSSHDVEVDPDDDDDDDDEIDDDDDEEDDEVVDGMDLDELSAAAEHVDNARLQESRKLSGEVDLNETPSRKLSPVLDERRLLYIKASMQVLASLYPHHTQHQLQPQPGQGHLILSRRPYLSLHAEDALLYSINDVVKPRKRPLNTKVIMRRAPTQEEFFRGSLSRNPISLSSLKPTMSNSSNPGSRRSPGGSGQNNSSDDIEPTVADLRQHIANDLQMADSAELIEIIVANKILDINLKLRVVHQVLWKNHLIDTTSISNGASASGLFSSTNSTSYFASAGSAISMIFSSSNATADRVGNLRITKDTPSTSLPPMVATYRLAGVDGEATEDTVSMGDLFDPEAPSDSASSEEIEQLMENEFGVTRIITKDRGVGILLRSVQNFVNDFLRRIRRDDVCCEGQRNLSRIAFKHSPPCNSLLLLRYCSKLSSNRQKLLQARAPTVLLRLLLDVLKVLEETSASSDISANSNPTAEILQELIEVLTSDISSSSDVDHNGNEGFLIESDQDVASMPLLLKSIETISLSPPLRSVIAKLLPFLTYGQSDLSRELAQHFNNHIVVEKLSDCENEIIPSSSRSAILMNTFVQTALSLPSNNVCNTLRTELLNCGFHERLAIYIMQDIPTLPPPWSTALYSEENIQETPQKGIVTKLQLVDAWRIFYSRGGLKTALKILTGLCVKHRLTQTKIGHLPDFLKCCHWIESTSDNIAANVETKGLGLLAETLLDEIMEGNEEVTKLANTIRKKTRNRKKELAESRRNLALLKLTSFGSSQATFLSPSTEASSVTRSGFASLLAPMVGFFRDIPLSNTLTSVSPNLDGLKPSKGKKVLSDKPSSEKPAWLTEAEMMEDELGLTCAVCQEGRTLQPSELLGLYAFVKKVSIPMEQCGSRASIDGTNLFRALPSILPDSLLGSHVGEEWFSVAKAAAEHMSRTSSSSLTISSSGGRRNSIFTTTVSAGNGIHISCHKKARQADKSHPKAPKSEWEGAALRNSRCSCNVILPLVSSRSSKVPLIAVDAALTDHQGSVSNLLGTSPKSMLWTVLHDIRFLVLRMSYGEALNADCGGGSLTSNCQLLFYQLLMADMFDHDAQIEQPYLSQHARSLSTALLAGCAILTAKDNSNKASVAALSRGVADAAPMAALTCILFHNSKSDDSKIEPSSAEVVVPHPKRQWIVGSEYFLKCLIICAGRRHALGIEGSGCQTSNRTRRAASFADWDVMNEGSFEVQIDETTRANDILDGVESFSQSKTRNKNKESCSSQPSIDDFQNVLRPMLTYYAIMNQLSAEFSVTADDVMITESAHRLESVICECQRAKNIHELLRNANIPALKHEDMIDLLQKGMVAAY